MKIFPNFRGEHEKYVKFHHLRNPRSQEFIISTSRLSRLVFQSEPYFPGNKYANFHGEQPTSTSRQTKPITINDWNSFNIKTSPINFPKKENTHPSRIVGVQTYFRYPSDIIRWNLTLKGNLHLPTEFALEKQQV